MTFYKLFIKPILFLFSPETVHKLVFALLRLSQSIPGFNVFHRKIYQVRDKSLEKEIFGLRFPNLVGLAAGFDKNAEVVDAFSSFGFGFIEIGTVTPVGQPGNPKPRLFRVTENNALINRMGFNNKGADAIIENLKRIKSDVIVGGNIGKNTATKNEDAIHDYVECFKKLYNYVDYIVINVSCPNIKNLNKLQDTKELEQIIKALFELRATYSTKKPILLKISPDLTFQHIEETIELSQREGIDGIIATNTTSGRENLSITEEKIAELGNGGLSGEPLRAKSTEIIRFIHKMTNGKLPIIGSGGIITVEDALEKLQAGASLIQLYTGFVYEGPGIVKKINKAIVRNKHFQ